MYFSASFGGVDEEIICSPDECTCLSTLERAQPHVTDVAL